jgi:hypothetical protein
MNSTSTTKRILAVMVVTTALCADQAAMASIAPCPQSVEIAQLASRLVSRLARNFQGTLPAVIRQPLRQQIGADRSTPCFSVAHAVAVAHTPLSPFQFRLPPPLV